MKIKNLSSTKTLQFNDLGSYMKGVSPILRDVKLAPGDSKYLLHTSEVLLSAQAGDIKRFQAAGLLELNDTVTATTTFTHDLGVMPNVKVLVDNSGDWDEPVYGTDYTLSHNADFTETTFTLITAGTYLISIG